MTTTRPSPNTFSRAANVRLWRILSQAVVKALGQGLSVPLDSFEIALGPGERPEIGRWNVPGAAVKRLQLCCFEPAAGYVGALAFSAL